jgi:ABC-2 type transport system permease protein
MTGGRRRPVRPGFTDVLRAEASKLWTMRSAWWTLAAMAAGILGVAVFVGATRSLQPDDTVLGGSLTGATLGLMIGASFGVLMMTGEHTSGMLRTTLLACPRRGLVLAAKAVVTAASLFVVALAACSLAFLAGAALLSGDGYAPGAPWPALLGVALSFSLTGLLGLTVGTLLRHPGGAVTTMLAGILVPSLLGPLLGDWERWVAGASPLAATQKLSQTSDVSPELAGSLAGWPSLLLIAGYVVAALLAAWVLLRRRDVR